MIVRPTSSRLISLVRKELAESIAPALDDPRLKVNLQMIDAILGGIAIRSDHEVAWILEEIAEIQAVGEAIAKGSGAGAARVAEALAELRARRSSSLHVNDLLDDYDRAGEVLSRALEAAVPANSNTGGDLRKRVEALLDSRLEKAAAIRGDFKLVGRD